MYADAHSRIFAALAAAFAPRQHLSVSAWADRHVILSRKTSPEPGPWRTDRNPLLQEPMDCLSARSTVRDVVVKFPIQMGKSSISLNAVGYWMTQSPGPIMVAFPAEVSMHKWINQKLNTLLDDVPVVATTLTSTSSRNAANTKEFKDFTGGQLYIEHAGASARLKSTSVKYLIVDELTEFAANLKSGDDPMVMLEDRLSAYSSTYKRLDLSSPGIRGLCRIDERYEASDQRRYHMPCPHCQAEISFEWPGLQWTDDGHNVAYACPDCGSLIDEHHKPAMIQAGRWIPAHPGRPVRGYTANALYYPIGLGPRWADLVRMWLDSQNDPARLKTFINSRLAEAWEDPALRAAKLHTLADRAEAYPLMVAPLGVAIITAGVDTQDDRLEIQIVGWGKNLKAWTLGYIILPGDPADSAVWRALETLLNTPIEHVNGHKLAIAATNQDAGGHKTENVYDFARQGSVRRYRPTFGAVPRNAPVMSKPKAIDYNHRGQTHKRGVTIQHVGTIAIKDKFFGRLGADADKAAEDRMLHFSDELPPEYFRGLLSETFNPRTGRYDKKRGARNEALDTWVLAYAATHHPELRLHQMTHRQWDDLLAKYATALDPTFPAVGLPDTQPARARKPRANSTLL